LRPQTSFKKAEAVAVSIYGPRGSAVNPPASQSPLAGRTQGSFARECARSGRRGGRLRLNLPASRAEIGELRFANPPYVPRAGQHARICETAMASATISDHVVSFREVPKMLRRVVAALAIGLSAVTAVNALSVSSYRDEKNDDMRKLNRAYLAGVRDGLVAVNQAIASERKKPYFCLPDDGTLKFERAEEILIQEGSKSRSLEHMPAWAILFEGLKDTFPCKDLDK
jgi:hypothetical protein